MNTNNWKLDLFASLDSADSLQAIMSASLDAIRPFGFDYCGWRTDLPIPGQTKKSGITVLNAIEDEVCTTTAKGEYESGPIPQHCARSMLPIGWRGSFDEDVFLRSPNIMEEYYGLGHRGGWAITTMSPDGTRGMFYVESKHILSSSELSYAEQHMQWVSFAAYIRLLETEKNSNIKISQEESDVLKYLSHNNLDFYKTSLSLGKNILEIVDIIDQIGKKLNCKNIHSIISRAMFLKLIDH